MFVYFCVAAGGALGSLARFWVAGAVAGRLGNGFPWGTLLINVTGSLLIGVFAALNEADGRAGGAQAFRQFFMVGICGGYTTFSSFSLETLRQMQQGQWLFAGGYVMMSVLFCLIGVGIGYWVGQILNSVK